METPQPSPAAQTDDPDRVARLRRLDCRHYDACLHTAAREKWESFSCRACAVSDRAEVLVPVRLVGAAEVDA